MKKVLILAGAFAVLAMTSCKKDYTCDCDIKDSSGTIDDYTAVSTLNGYKSDEAETASSDKEGTVGTLTYTCTLNEK